MALTEQITKENLPKHIAITMDGNGRWAEQKGKFRVFGHQNGVKAVRETVESAAEIGIKFLTLYAFSTENWDRSKKEVNALMTLLISTINKETKTLMDNNIRLDAIGDLDQLPEKCKKELNQAIEKTKSNKRMTLILALSYSGRWEIINAVNKMILEEAKQVTEEGFQQYLNTKGVPDPELLIRTSGEKRISNFLLWQIAYTELYFTDTLWPDFRKEDLVAAILDYQKRDRRFGKTIA
ncbi:MAG: isoprenyl transferase [Flavobacteriales bacterium TMED123]|mgnify:CR=1 FL=1|nr:MAG: isoprenyl transferase [Flavobacteriales bacterium TMED123]|tara:strand:+ start:7198 stop:7911 length:714 start_codon:yes stop_codon:yes gene_type:complete